jgi:translation initiation factor 3 subunit I
MFTNGTINVKQYRGQGFMTISKFNSSGDLLFIADKDSKYISLISTIDNKLIGTYNGHNGVVWHLDMTDKYLISCSGDMTFIIWNILDGDMINSIQETGIPKYVSINDKLVIIACDSISKRTQSYIKIYSLEDLINGNSQTITKIETGFDKKATTVNFLTDDIILVTYDNGLIQKINYKTNEVIQESTLHTQSIKSLSFSNNKTQILTCSLDTFAYIIYTDSLEIIKTFKSTVPINYAIFTPDENYVILGGGIEAMQVSKTCDNDLTTKIYDVSTEKIYKQIINHFGPIRYLNFNPNKSSFVSASQDGTVKIQYLVPIVNVKHINHELFGYALDKEDNDLFLNSETVKITDIKTNNTNDTNITKSKKTIKNEQQVYPVGHPLYSKSIKEACEYRISSKIEIEQKSTYTVKVSNLPDDVSINELTDMFEYCGRIEPNGIRIKHFFNGIVAFINYLDNESAIKAIERCNKRKIGCCIISVETAR